MRASEDPGPEPGRRTGTDHRGCGGVGRAARSRRLRFDGWIAGMGTSSGTRIVLGHWECSPFGVFSDLMVEHPDGERLLLAPSRETADFISCTYAFDAVRVVAIDVHREKNAWSVAAGPLVLRFTTRRRGPLGWLLRAVPWALAGRPAWAVLTDLPARLFLPGVRTRGRVAAGARPGTPPRRAWRRQWYGARDLRPIGTVSALLDGTDLGDMTPVVPAVRFGFASAPRKPAVARITTTVEPAE